MPEVTEQPEERGEASSQEEQNIAQQTRGLFNAMMDKHQADVGEAPHVYHLCHTHRAAAILHVDTVTTDNVSEVDRPHCMMCRVDTSGSTSA